jgi:hypothetical protein
MIDNFALALTHGLLLLVAWRLMSRPDLDDDLPTGEDSAAPKSSRWSLGKGRADA